MRIILIGRAESTVELAALFPNRPDFRIAKFGDVTRASEIIDGSEPALALMHVDADDLSSLEDVHRLAGRGVQLVVLASASSASLRAAAFDAGAADVLYPPINSKRVEAAVLSLLGRPARRETRFRAAVPAIIGAHLPGAPTFKGSVVDLSRGGLRAVVPGMLATGTVVRVALNPPAPHRIPTLFAIVLSTEPADDPGWSTVRARFVGITDEERATLTGFVETLMPESGAPSGALAAVLAMDIASLAEADLGTVAGMRLPALTAAERLGLLAAPKSKERVLADAALLRARATMLSDLLGRYPELEKDAREQLDVAALRAQAKAAADGVREALRNAGAADNANALRDLNDLQARLAIALDLVERTVARVTGTAPEAAGSAKLQEQTGTVTFDRPRTAEDDFAAPAKPRPRLSPSVRAGLSVALLLVLTACATELWLATRNRRVRDPALDAVAATPAIIAGPVRVRSIYTDPRGIRVAVVDGSWFRAQPAQREAAAREISAKAARGKALAVRDYRARLMASVTTNGSLTLYPVPVAP